MKGIENKLKIAKILSKHWENLNVFSTFWAVRGGNDLLVPHIFAPWKRERGMVKFDKQKT